MGGSVVIYYLFITFLYLKIEPFFVFKFFWLPNFLSNLTSKKNHDLL